MFRQIGTTLPQALVSLEVLAEARVSWMSLAMIFYRSYFAAAVDKV